MKTRKTLVAALICLGPVCLSAQDYLINECKMTFLLPTGYESVELDEHIQTYQSSRSDTFLAMSKTIRDSNYDHFTARSIAMTHFNDINLDEEAFNARITEEVFARKKFTVIRWHRKSKEKQSSYYMTAYNDDCDVVYKIELCTTKKFKGQIDKEFIDFLASCDTF